MEPRGPHPPHAVAGGQGGGGGAKREPHPPHQADSQQDEADWSREVHVAWGWDQKGDSCVLLVFAVILCCMSGTSLPEPASGDSWVIPGYSLMCG